MIWKIKVETKKLTGRKVTDIDIEKKMLKLQKPEGMLCSCILQLSTIALVFLYLSYYFLVSLFDDTALHNPASFQWQDFGL